MPSLYFGLSTLTSLILSSLLDFQSLMASREPPEPQNFKTWVLRVSIHCEGCKKKVKKIISQVPGVYSAEIDIRQQKVTVTGDVEADSLIRKLVKSGKNAELWPQPQHQQQQEKKPGNSKNKEKQQEAAAEQHHQETPSIRVSGKNKEIKPKPTEIDSVQSNPTKKIEEKIENRAKGEEGTIETGGNSNKAVKSASKESGGDQVEKEELKSEGNKMESKSASGEPPVVAEKSGGVSEQSGDGGKSVGGGGGGETDKSGKKKKKKGQNGNSTPHASVDSSPTPSSSSAKPADIESPSHHDGGPHAGPFPANESLPRHYSPHGSHHYYPGPPRAPVYGVSYNTAYPTSSHTASYYAAQPPTDSYVYAYPGPQVHPPPPPSDLDSYPRQPLDSFEMFSDENPNGCLVM